MSVTSHSWFERIKHRAGLSPFVWLAATLGLAATFSAGCLDLSAPPLGTPTPLPTPTVTAPATNTPAPPTITSTSTVTPTMTATATPTVPAPTIGFDPNTGLPVVPPFGPPTGATPIPGASGLPGAGLPGTGLPGQPGSLPGSLPGGATPPTSGGSAPAAGGGAPAASPVWGCDGDERMEFVPPQPRVGDKVFIFVTGARDRAFGLIVGPGLSGVQGANVDGGTGLKKRWEITPAAPGAYTYSFYGGPYPEHLCVTGTVQVAPPPGSGTATPTVTPTSVNTPTATSSPRPDH